MPTTEQLAQAITRIGELQERLDTAWTEDRDYFALGVSSDLDDVLGLLRAETAPLRHLKTPTSRVHAVAADETRPVRVWRANPELPRNRWGQMQGHWEDVPHEGLTSMCGQWFDASGFVGEAIQPRRVTTITTKPITCANCLRVLAKRGIRANF